MEKYLADLNLIAYNVIGGGNFFNVLYAKVVEGKVAGYEFLLKMPSITDIDPQKVSVDKKLLFEHYRYLTSLIDMNAPDENKYLEIKDDIQRTLQSLYEDQRSRQIFKKENENSIVSIFTNSIVDFAIKKAQYQHVENATYQSKISARNFMNAWQLFFQRKEVLKNYDSNKEFTQDLLGKFNGDVKPDNHSPLIKHIIKQLGVELRIYREDKFGDLSFYSRHKFENVFSLHYEKEKRQNVNNNYHWSSQCMISLEHENDYLKSYEEMMYLTTRRARLKVLVTYFDDHEEEANNIRNVLETLCANFSTIVQQSNSIFQENEQTEYLLILGSKMKNPEEKVVWSMQTFNWAGQWTEKHSSL